MEVSLCSEHVPGGFGGRAGPEVVVTASSPRVCWQPPQWWEAGLESEGDSQSQVPTRASPRLHTSCHSIVGESKSQVEGAGVLRELNLPPD